MSLTRMAAAQLTALAVALAACSSGAAPSSGGTPSPTTTMAVVAGDGQYVLADSIAPISPAVRVTGMDGTPVAGVDVTFAVPDYSGGSVSDAMTTTGSDGVAAVGQWKVYGLPGSSTVIATAPNVNGSPAMFTANVLGRLRILPVVSTDRQQAPAGTTLQIPPQANVSSPDVVATAGLVVVFRVISGGGSITGDTAVVDNLSTATVGSWTLGPTPGLNQLRAVVLQPVGSDSTIITATGT